MAHTKLNVNQVAVLRLLAEGKSAYTYCIGRAEHGARTCTVMALRRRGHVKAWEITEQGRAALAAAVAQNG